MKVKGSSHQTMLALQFLGEMNKQFGFGLSKQEAEQAPAETKELLGWVKARARQVYSKREVEFPVKIANGTLHVRTRCRWCFSFDREGIANWAKSRFQTTQSFEEFCVCRDKKSSTAPLAQAILHQATSLGRRSTQPHQAGIW